MTGGAQPSAIKASFCHNIQDGPYVLSQTSILIFDWQVNF